MQRPAPLNAIRVFVQAANALSFKKAAADLCVTPGAVSRQILALEQHLGIQLFERKFREVTLTQMGQVYLAQVGPAVAAIDKATERITHLTNRAIVRIGSTPTFAMHWLIPRLAQFHASHPEIEVKLSTSSGNIDKSDGADVYIRRDPKQFSGLRAECFMLEFSRLVCSPKLPHWKRLNSPQAIARSPRIAMRSRRDLWPKWFTLFGQNDDAEIKTPIELDNTILAIQAALEGLGVALIPCLFLQGLLESNSLVSLPKMEAIETGAYHLLVRQIKPTAETLVFMGWLHATAISDEGP